LAADRQDEDGVDRRHETVEGDEAARIAADDQFAFAALDRAAAEKNRFATLGRVIN